MAKQYLRDKRGALLGSIEIRSDGKQELRNSRGVLKGTYDPKSNKTHNERGELVGTGNLLTSRL